MHDAAVERPPTEPTRLWIGFAVSRESGRGRNL